MACYMTKNPNHHIAICTLWFDYTKHLNELDDIDDVDDIDYNMIGFCRTKAGIELMAITLLEHNEITDLIIIEDESRGIIDEVLKLNQLMNEMISLDSTSKDLTLIRLHRMLWKDLKPSKISKISKPSKPLHESIKIIKKDIESSESSWPHRVGYCYTSDSIKQLYHYALHQIYRRGEITVIRDIPARQLYCINLTLMNQKSIEIHRELQSLFPKTVLDDYYQRYQLTHSSSSSNQAYEYSSRLSSYSQSLFQKSNTKTWFPIFRPEDTRASETPCCVGIQTITKPSGSLDMIGVFRSNDMKEAWPLNLMGLRYMQEQIVDKMNSTQTNKPSTQLGNLTTISINAHYYETSKNHLDDAKKFISIPIEIFNEVKYDDPEGYYVVIGIEKEKKEKIISVKYYDKKSNHIKEYIASKKDYEDLIIRVTSEISSPSHAAYVSKEIVKIALS